jgi:predicted ATPase
MVGRAAELGRLRTAFGCTADERRASVLTVIGEAGIGKTRIALEIADALAGEARILIGRCPAYGDGITFWPLREIVLQAAGDLGRDGALDLLVRENTGQADAALVAGAIGLTEEPGRAAELFPAFRRLFEVLARRQPLVVMLEDAHWAQPTLLDLVEYLAASTPAAVLFLCLARPDLLEQRPAWARDRDHAGLLVLEPLGRDDTQTLIVDRLAGRALATETVQRIVDMSQGNPLFVEQMLASLRDERELSIPLSLQALLAARLDRLGPAERDLVRCASVAGIEFSMQALAALVPDEARPYVGTHLQVLEEKELIRSSRDSFLGQPAFTFRHALIQLAAYRSMTRQDRSELHAQFAHWLENAAGVTPLEFDETIGYHLEQAYMHRRDVGLLDEHTGGLARRAGDRLARAGLRAYARFDMAAAENLLSRARPLLPSDHPKRREVMRRLAETYPVLGRSAEADAAFAALLEEIRPDEEGRIEQGIRLERLRIRLITGPDPTRLDTIRTEAQRALEEFGKSADHVGMSQACYLLAFVHLRSGDMRALEEASRRGLAHAELTGDVRE